MCLCTPPRQGKKHVKSTESYTAARLDRWERGERLSLWRDASEAGKKKRISEKWQEEQRKIERAEKSVREGCYAKACSALTQSGVAANTVDTQQTLRNLHPEIRGPNLP